MCFLYLNGAVYLLEQSLGCLQHALVVPGVLMVVETTKQKAAQGKDHQDREDTKVQLEQHEQRCNLTMR